MTRAAVFNPGFIRSNKRGPDDAPDFYEVAADLSNRLANNPRFIEEATGDTDWTALAAAYLDDDAILVMKLLCEGVHNYLNWHIDKAQRSGEWEKELGRLESAFFPAPRFAA